MRDRAVRRHHEFKVKRKLTQKYTSCIQGLSSARRMDVEGNVEKLKKVCASPYSGTQDRKLGNKTVQERRHDITMREQLS